MTEHQHQHQEQKLKQQRDTPEEDDIELSTHQESIKSGVTSKLEGKAEPAALEFKICLSPNLALALLIEALEKQNKAAEVRTRKEELKSIITGMAGMANMTKMKQHK